MKVYYDQDANLNTLKDKTVAIIGYGSQGHAHAQNLRDSGINVIIGQRPGGANWQLAKEHGFEPVSASEAAKQADIIQILVQDQYQPAVYENEIQAHLRAGKTLVFGHGFNIHYGQIEPPQDIDVVMIAPKGPGHLVRREFEKGGGVPALVAVHRNASGRALETALAYAKGIGATRSGVLQTSFQEETETDLFGEQAVLCGGATALIQAGFQTLVDAGYQPEIAYFECMHELKLIVDLLYEGGLKKMHHSISDTAEYGDYTRGPRVINEQSRQEMKKILTEIQNGTFAKQWILENSANCPSFKAMRRISHEQELEKIGDQLRSMMPWLQKK